ncbi:hypothetical protein FRC01_003109 [Tulasnella sp. 417]|nr:hypothetical protein FRC01_003109 [Tulasnella sp. 417]
MSHIVVTGVPNPSPPGPAQTAPPPRLEINNLVANEKHFSLYIQALQRMYATPQTQGASHFQLGGIHGLPFQPWEGAGARQVPGSRFGGYCTHGTVLFPSWHRPYLAIYEQILHQHAVEIAQTYTVDTAAWNAAAQELRMPYWDWASNSVPPAQVISMAQVTITAPNGQRTAVQNPLLGYRFNPIDRSFPSPYSRWPTTLRHPQSASASAQSNVNEMIAWLRSDQEDIRDSTFNLLTRVRTWPAFSNHTTGDGGSASNSIEAIHDGLHVDIGGNGHMSDPSVAAFDPIFFLHHANVDRITALWQAINPDVWVTRGRGAAGTWTLPSTTLQDTNTDLTPFWNGAQTFWDSTDSRDWSAKLGYTYPEFVGLNLGDKAAVRAAISARVNQLYGDGPRRTFAFAAASAPAIAESAAELVGQTPATHAAPPAAMRLFALPARPAAAAAAAQAPVPEPPAASAEGATYTDWTARIHVNKYAVGSSFSVLIFLGPVPEDPAQWRTSESYVGAHHVFMNSAAEECENCRNTAEAQIEGFVHLNKAIAARSGLNSFDPEVVEPYLKENLSWKILKVDCSSADVSEVSSLQVIVIATPLAFEDGEVFPHAGTGRHCHEITEGQPGGYHTH